MEISLAISPCPNDTFIFGAMINNLIDNEGINFNVTFADIKELNQIAKKEESDIIKVSYFTYLQIQEKFTLMENGSALGRGCGPLLISNKKLSYIDLNNSIIGIPGFDTTANLLLHYFLPNPKTKVFLFHEIMPKLLNNEIDLGLIIHESRFVYKELGLNLIQDLGEYWEENTKSAIPLGGIIANKKIDNEIINKIDNLIHKSIIYAKDNSDIIMPFIEIHAQEMNIDVMKSHIDLYVNEFSLGLGIDGHNAIEKLNEIAQKINIH